MALVTRITKELKVPAPIPFGAGIDHAPALLIQTLDTSVELVRPFSADRYDDYIKKWKKEGILEKKEIKQLTKDYIKEKEAKMFNVKEVIKERKTTQKRASRKQRVKDNI